MVLYAGFWWCILFEEENIYGKLGGKKYVLHCLTLMLEIVERPRSIVFKNFTYMMFYHQKTYPGLLDLLLSLACELEP